MTLPFPSMDPGYPKQWAGLAQVVCERYYAEFPDYDDRYGQRGRDWCVHDNAYLIAWLVDELELGTAGSFARNVAWLVGLLEARGFPMEGFWRNLELVRDAVADSRPEDAERASGLVAAVMPS